jgi:CheY-like chemotaxis protein
VIKILLIEADPARAAALAAALGGGGTEVRIAPDGFYALTMMERERPDLVVAGGCGGGIGAGELGAIVRSDPALAGVRLALYADPAAPPADLNGGGVYDLVLDSATPARELADGLRRLAGLPAAAAPAEHGGPAAPRRSNLQASRPRRCPGRSRQVLSRRDRRRLLRRRPPPPSRRRGHGRPRTSAARSGCST